MYRSIPMLLAAAMLVLPAALSDAEAQNTLTRNEVVGSLVQLEDAARRLDAAALRRQAEAQIRAEGTEDTANRKPISATLSKLRQFVIEVQFDFDSAAIRPASYRTIGVMADALHHPNLWDFKFLVIGHTDSKGDRLYNLKLSQRRADSIRNALIEAFRVSPNRLVALGLGEEQLRDTKNPEAAVNRRVQLINIGR